jgi:hypothetical protein
MIPAVLVLSLLALLVATDPEPAATPVHPLPEPPLRPDGKNRSEGKAPEAGQLAA